MLQIVVPEFELFDEETSTFKSIKQQTLQLEHSLVSLSKWESKWNKAFLSKKDKTREETLDYIRCMTLTKNVDPDLYRYLPANIIAQVNDYISAPMSATYLHRPNSETRSQETITSELIYYWMISLNIPFECQKWHLSRLLKLIEVCNVKNKAPSNRMSQREIMRDHARINAARRKRLNTRG